MPRIRLIDALQRVAHMADAHLQAAPDIADADDAALTRIEDLIGVLQMRIDKEQADKDAEARGAPARQPRRPVVIDPETDEELGDLRFANLVVEQRPPEPTQHFTCDQCDDTGTLRRRDRHGRRVSTGRPCPVCGDMPTDTVAVRLLSSGRVVRPYQRDLTREERSELQNLAAHAPEASMRSRARAVLTASVDPMPAQAAVAEAEDRVAEAVLRQGARDGRSMNVPWRAADFTNSRLWRTVRPGDRLSPDARSMLHEWRTGGHSCADLITDILMAEPDAVEAQPEVDQYGLPVGEAQPAEQPYVRPEQGAPAQPGERVNVHYLKFGTSSSEHGVEVIRPGDMLTSRQIGAINATITLCQRSIELRRARPSQRQRLALAQRILREHVPF